MKSRQARLPEGWEMKKLGEMSKIMYGHTAKTSLDSNGVKYLRITDIQNGSVDWNSVPSCPQLDDNFRKYELKYGDIVFARTGATTGKSYLIKDPPKAVFASYLIRVQTDQKEILPEFLSMFFQSASYWNVIEAGISGSAQGGFNAKKLSSISIPIPPLPEQKQIVALLDQAFAAIDQAKANIEQNIANAKELFDSKKSDYFKRLAVENQLTPINEACEKIFAGGDKPKENFSKTPTKELNIPIIANAVKDNGLYGYTNLPKVTKPSITVAARGSGTGHTEFRDYPFVPIVRLIVLTPNTEIVNVEFLMHAIKNLTISRSGSAIPQLTVPMIKGYSIPIPPKEIQTEIVENLNRLEIELNQYKVTLERKISELTELKKSLLQKAFAGELTNPVPI